MPDLHALAAQLADGSIEVIDLTSPLHAGTPILALPPQFGQTATFQLEEISRYDDRGPAWYWNNFHTGEHTGTHFDAPNHWVTGQALGRRRRGARPARLIGPAVVIDRARRGGRRPRLPARRRRHHQLGSRARRPPGGRLADLPHRLVLPGR